MPVTVEGEAVELNRAVRMVMNASGRPYAISFRGKTVLVVVSTSKPKAAAEPPKTGATAPKKTGG